MKFGSIMLSETNQSQMAMYCMILFIRNVQNRPIYRNNLYKSTDLWYPGVEMEGIKAAAIG